MAIDPRVRQTVIEMIQTRVADLRIEEKRGDRESVKNLGRSDPESIESFANWMRTRLELRGLELELQVLRRGGEIEPYMKAHSLLPEAEREVSRRRARF